MLHGVIFDMDGVLVDSSEAHFEAFSEFGRGMGATFTWEFFRSAFGLHNDEIFPRWLGPGLTREQVKQYAAEKEAIYRRLAPSFVRPVEGVLDLLDSLAEAGFLLAVGSSGPRENVEMALDITGRRKLFQTTVCGDDVPRGKPAPDVFLKAAANLGLAPAKCLVIEDALAGIEAARAAQMKVVAIATSLPIEKLQDATRSIHKMEELGPAAVLEILANPEIR